MRAQDITYLVKSADKAREELGWEVRILLLERTIQDTLEATWRELSSGGKEG